MLEREVMFFGIVTKWKNSWAAVFSRDSNNTKCKGSRTYKEPRKKWDSKLLHLLLKYPQILDFWLLDPHQRPTSTKAYRVHVRANVSRKLGKNNRTLLLFTQVEEDDLFLIFMHNFLWAFIISNHRGYFVNEILDFFHNKQRLFFIVLEIITFLLCCYDTHGKPLQDTQELVVKDPIFSQSKLAKAFFNHKVNILLGNRSQLKHSLHFLFLNAILRNTVLNTCFSLMTVDLFYLFATRTNKWYYFSVLTNVSTELSELILFFLYFSNFLKDFGNSRVKGFTFHHKGWSLKKLDASEQNGYKLREFDAVVDHIESVIECFEFIIIVIELDKAQEIPKFWKDLIIPKEMKNVLISHTEILLFILLLIFYNEIIEKYFIEFV